MASVSDDVPEQNAPSKASSGLRSAYEFVKTIVIAVLIAAVIRTFAFEPFSIPSGSMKPTLLIGDYLFVSKYAYGYSRHSFPWSLAPFDGRILGSPPERGDVVVFKTPADNSTDYIKRVIGLPGDRIQVTNGELFLNGKLVQRERIGKQTERGIFGDEVTHIVYEETLPGGRRHLIMEATDTGRYDNTRVFTVPDGHFFAMGDNRDNSEDSRSPQVGPVPFENLVGRAEIIFFSVDGNIWAFWDWPSTIRGNRLLKSIQ